MTDMAGVQAIPNRMSAHLQTISSSIDAGDRWSYPGFVGILPAFKRLNTIDENGNWHHVPPFVSRSWGGSQAFTSQIWDRIILSPQTTDFGNILSNRESTIEVFNTFRDRYQTMTAINVSGTGGLVVTNPFGLPIPFPPLGSRIFPISLLNTGDATVNNSVSFTFTNLPNPGFVASGTRVLVFWAPMDWSEPFKETITWFTTVLESYDGTEQRIRLRYYPRMTAEFRVLTMDRRSTTMLENYLFANQTKLWGVPWWPEKTILLQSANIGDTILYADTTDRLEFESGGLIMLWASPLKWEAIMVNILTPGVLNLSATLTKSWPTGSVVVPLKTGYLEDSIPVNRPTNWLSAATFSFVCEKRL